VTAITPEGTLHAASVFTDVMGDYSSGRGSGQ
jgi:hypothetical protein